MGKIFITSDLHFCHDRDFVWKARGFNSIEEMNETIVKRFNEKVSPEDTVYILGDIMLNNNEEGEKYLSQLNGELHIILGNHDTASRIEIYKKYAVEVVYATTLKYKKKSFYLSHYPTLTGNGDDPKVVINLHGHTHQTTAFTEGYGFMYHVGMDSNMCYPISLDEILENLKDKNGGRKNEI